MGELTILRMFPDPCGSWLACESGVSGDVGFDGVNIRCCGAHCAEPALGLPMGQVKINIKSQITSQSEAA